MITAGKVRAPLMAPNEPASDDTQTAGMDSGNRGCARMGPGPRTCIAACRGDTKPLGGPQPTISHPSPTPSCQLPARLPRPVLSNEKAWGMVMELYCYELVELGWDGWDGIIPALWHVSLLLMCHVLCSNNKSTMCLETLYIPSSILYTYTVSHALHYN